MENPPLKIPCLHPAKHWKKTVMLTCVFHYLQATLQRDVEPLLRLMSYTRKLEWPKNRIQRLWPRWVAAVDKMEQEIPFKHKKLHVSLDFCMYLQTKRTCTRSYYTNA